jgi:hypothetical protein
MIYRDCFSNRSLRHVMRVHKRSFSFDDAFFHWNSETYISNLIERVMMFFEFLSSYMISSPTSSYFFSSVSWRCEFDF